MSSTNHSYEAELCRVDETSAEIVSEVLAEMRAEHTEGGAMEELDRDRPTLSTGQPADHPFGLDVAPRGSPDEIRKQREKGAMKDNSRQLARYRAVLCREMTLEEALADLEQEYGPIIADLDAALREEHPPYLEPQEEQ